MLVGQITAGIEIEAGRATGKRLVDVEECPVGRDAKFIGPRQAVCHNPRATLVHQGNETFLLALGKVLVCTRLRAHRDPYPTQMVDPDKIGRGNLAPIHLHEKGFHGAVLSDLPHTACFAEVGKEKRLVAGDGKPVGKQTMGSDRWVGCGGGHAIGGCTGNAVGPVTGEEVPIRSRQDTLWPVKAMADPPDIAGFRLQQTNRMG